MGVLTVLYREEGIQFVDPGFPPAEASLYAGGGNDGDSWRCAQCGARNAVPPDANGREAVLALMQRQRRGDLPLVRCAACGREHPVLEVAMRPSAWLRPGDLRDDVTGLTSDVPWEVFRGEPRADDIRQGGVGNCWYVCALSILAEAAPETLKNCVVTRAYNPAGAYKLRLCLAGEWRTLLVDDLLPCNALEMLAYVPARADVAAAPRPNRLVSTQVKAARRALWAPLLEKAAAKLHGSYEALAGGTFAEAFHTLTGFPVDQERLHGYTRDGGAWAAHARARGAAAGGDDGAVFREAFDKRFPGGADEAEVECFARVFSFFESGFAVGASTFTDPATPFGQEMKAKGLQTRHAYGLLECRVYDGEHLFKLRNPNGVALWKGKWSREDAERMTFAARKALGLDREDPGVFWMAVDDFLAYFVELTVCRVLRDRVDARVGGWLGSAFNGGECVAVEAYARTRLDVALYQEPHAVRQGEAGAATALDLGCAVVKCASRSDRAVAGDDPRTHRLVAAAPRVAHRAGAACHLTLEHDDDPTTRYLVVPLCFGHRHSVEPRRFRAVVHSDLVCEVGVVSCEPSVVAAALAQIAEDSGKRAPLLEDSLKRPVVEILTIEDEAGIAFVAVNHGPNPVLIGLDATEKTRGFVSSRGTSLLSQDVIPPRSRCCLAILSRESGTALDSKVSLGWGFSAAVQPPGTPEAHIPELSRDGDIHLSLPMDAPRVGAGALAEALAAAMGTAQ